MFRQLSVRLALGLVMLLGVAGCGKPPLSVVVFIEATPWPQVNEKILNKYLTPVYERLVQTQKAVHLEVYAITANTEADTAVLTLDLPKGWRTTEEAEALAGEFRSLQERYQRVYPPGSSHLVDVLGATIVLDGFLGRTPAGSPVHVIYLSDMVQQEELGAEERSDRYDFTDRQNAKTLDQCRQDLEPVFNRFLSHRDRFPDVAAYLVPLGMDEILREGSTQTGVVTEYVVPATTTNQDEIRKFWQQDFFGAFLKVKSVALYLGGVQRALDDIGL
ncbi:MAG TPA: hypothetical protein DD490_16245 [Acidobacteria bacterium]|nr:hypothetical protein [Acidobacteriota bacterium]